MMRPPLVIGIGEVLWDVLPTGRQLGGAPANFAYHASALGARGSLISQVGDDTDGCAIIERLKANGLPTDWIAVDTDHPTGIVKVRVGADGQPHYDICEGAAWDYVTEDTASLSMVRNADAVCFGSLAQRSPVSRNAIRRLVGAAPENALRVFDVNLRLRYFSEEVLRQSLGLANVLKLNDDELPVLASMFGLDHEPKAMISAIAESFSLHTVVLTRGDHGSLIWHKGEWDEHPGIPATLSDTIGAGDSFTAAITLGLLRGQPLSEINDHANRLASYVCSCAGATPAIPATLRHLSPAPILAAS